MTLIDVLHAVARSLINDKIHFCLTGEVAYSLYTAPRATVNIDITTMTLEEPGKIREILKGVFPSVYENTSVFIYKLLSMRRYLLMFENQEFVFDHLQIYPQYKEYGGSLMSRVRTLPFEGADIPLIYKEDLIILKIASSREQDRLDVKNLLGSSAINPMDALDMVYIREWADRLGIEINEYS